MFVFNVSSSTSDFAQVRNLTNDHTVFLIFLNKLVQQALNYIYTQLPEQRDSRFSRIKAVRDLAEKKLIAPPGDTEKIKEQYISTLFAKNVPL